MKKKSLTEFVAAAVEEKRPRAESCERVEKSEDCALTYYGTEIKTVEELLEAQGIDLKIWEITKQTINNYEVTGKRRVMEGKIRGSDQLWKTGNRQIKVELKRRAPKPIQDAILELMKDMKPMAVAKPPKCVGHDKYLMEVGIHDHHFAKLCYGLETGTNYDLQIAEMEFRSAVDEMVRRAKWFNVEKIVLPGGSDFFHYDTERKETSNLTPMATSSDDRLSKAFRVGCRSMQYAVERFLAIAPVEIIYIPGNHDRTMSWFMTEWLAAKFDHSPDVTVFNSPTHRKYIAYGPSLLGYTHGDECPHDRLPTLMAQEVPEMWAKSTYRSWRTGHFHKKKQTRYIAGDTHNGVEVYVFPSLGGSDSWHYRSGYVGSARMAEVHFWSDLTGPAGLFFVHAREPKVQLSN